MWKHPQWCLPKMAALCKIIPELRILRCSIYLPICTNKLQMSPDTRSHSTSLFCLPYVCYKARFCYGHKMSSNLSQLHPVGCGTWSTWLTSDWRRWLSPVQTWTKDLHFSLTVPNAAICQPLEQTLKPRWWDSWGMLAMVYKTSVHPIGWLRLRDLKVELRDYQIFFFSQQ